MMKKMASALSLALLLASGSLYAEGDNSAVIVPAEQNNGAALLKESYDYLGSLKKYAFQANITNTVTEDGTEIVDKRAVDVKIKRPSQFRIDSKGDVINRSIYLSDGLFTMIDNNEKYYATVNTGGGIDKTLDMVNQKLGIILPTSTLMHSDMSKFIHPKKVQSFGIQKVGGVACNYIAFKQNKTTVHMWIENSDKPLVRAAKVITPKEGTTEMVMKWDTDPDFSDSVFIFKAPEGASNISIKPVK